MFSIFYISVWMIFKGIEYSNSLQTDNLSTYHIGNRSTKVVRTKNFLDLRRFLRSLLLLAIAYERRPHAKHASYNTYYTSISVVYDVITHKLYHSHTLKRPSGREGLNGKAIEHNKLYRNILATTNETLT